jgi:hypothetical protein
MSVKTKASPEPIVRDIKCKIIIQYDLYFQGETNE